MCAVVTDILLTLSTTWAVKTISLEARDTVDSTNKLQLLSRSRKWNKNYTLIWWLYCDNVKFQKWWYWF